MVGQGARIEDLNEGGWEEHPLDLPWDPLHPLQAATEPLRTDVKTLKG